MTAPPVKKPPPPPQPAPAPAPKPPFRPRPMVARGHGRGRRKLQLHVAPRHVGATRTSCGLFPIEDDTLPWYRAREATCARCRAAWKLPPIPEQLPLLGGAR